MTDLATVKYQSDKDKCVMLMPILIPILSTEGRASVYLSNGIIMTDEGKQVLLPHTPNGANAAYKYRKMNLETSCQLGELFRDNQSYFPFSLRYVLKMWYFPQLHPTSNSMSQTIPPALVITVTLRYYK